MTPLETIQNVYKAYGAGDIEGALSYCADDVCFRWVAEPELMAYAGECNGKAAFLERLNALHKDYEYHSFRPIEIIDGGDRLAAQVEMELTRRDNGKKFVLHAAEFWTVRNGAVTHMVEYYDTAKIAEMNKPVAVAA
ncbi:MAG: nuclear transport factor 2 family protein [Pseudaminobacter sp.]|nr:nuclear transport factor 2 family protein [Pseudaminobacter sp.]